MPSQQSFASVGRQHFTQDPYVQPVVRPSTSMAHHPPEIPGRGAFFFHLPRHPMRLIDAKADWMHRRARSVAPASDTEGYPSQMGRTRSRRHDSRAAPIRYQDRGYTSHVASPAPSRVPEIGLHDLTRVVTTTNRYPSAHGGSSDVWQASWSNETGVREVYHYLPSSIDGS